MKHLLHLSSSLRAEDKSLADALATVDARLEV